MAPIFAVHGCCQETGYWFEDVANLPLGGTPSDTVAGRLAEEGFPVFTRFYINPNGNSGTIRNGAAIWVGMLKMQAASLGVNSCHLLAHSKGGLWSRAMLISSAGGHSLLSEEPNPIRVLSLVTMDTPHSGSVGADIVALRPYLGSVRSAGPLPGRLGQYVTQVHVEGPYNAAVLTAVLRDRIELIGDPANPWDSSQVDLTQEAVRDFNRISGVPASQITLPNPLGRRITTNFHLRTVAADANLDQDHNSGLLWRSIAAAESAGFPFGFFVGETLYNFLGRAASVSLLRDGSPTQPTLIRAVDYPVFRENDFAVTVDSQTVAHSSVSSVLWAPIDAAQPFRAQSGAHHNSVSSVRTANALRNFYRNGSQFSASNE